MFSGREIRQHSAHRSLLFYVRENENLFRRNQPGEPFQRFLKQGLFRDQAQELLRARTAAQGPETFATPRRLK